MPVQLTERALRDAIAVIGEHDDAGAREAESALHWMGWEGEGPLLLRRYDVQLFAWYTLPRKFLTSLEHKRAAAQALARTLERLGERAAGYADVCRSAETDALRWRPHRPRHGADVRRRHGCADGVDRGRLSASVKITAAHAGETQTRTLRLSLTR